MAEAREFQDWELLHNSETGTVHPSVSLDNSKDFVEIEGVSEVIIRSDYFASDSMKRYALTVAETVDSSGEVGSVCSDNPSWVEPCSRYLNDPRNEFHRKNSGEFWSDSSCDEHASHKLINFDENHELVTGDSAQAEVGFEEIGEIRGFEEKSEKVPILCSDSGGEASIRENLECLEEEEKDSVHGIESSEVVDGDEDRGETAEAKGTLDGEAMVSDEGEKKGMVWWKLPFEILKFCLFKVNPGWSIAVAAAVMGIVILRRRLHKMKRKSRTVPLILTMEDKKVSQFMKNAARLNEAFSVVKRVPIIRPLLPAPTGVTPWPMINLR